MSVAKPKWRRQYRPQYRKDKNMSVTSSASKRKYNNKTYDRITVSVKKETAAAYKAKCEALGIPLSEPLHQAIAEFLKT